MMRSGSARTGPTLSCCCSSSCTARCRWTCCAPTTSRNSEIRTWTALEHLRSRGGEKAGARGVKELQWTGREQERHCVVTCDDRVLSVHSSRLLSSRPSCAPTTLRSLLRSAPKSRRVDASAPRSSSATYKPESARVCMSAGCLIDGDLQLSCISFGMKVCLD